MTDFLPCPFCGSDKVSTVYIRDGRRACCCVCGAAGRPAYNGTANMPSADERARLAWNARTPALTHGEEE